MFSTIVFDYGGVVEISDRNVVGDIIAHLNISKEDWKREYFKLNHLSNVDNRDWNEIVLMVAEKFDASEDTKEGLRALFQDLEKSKKINAELIAIIRSLKKGYKIGLLSNYTTRLKEKLQAQGILDLFDTVVVSAEVGHQKPEPEIFEYLFQKMGVKPQDVIFIDDTEKSLEGAERIGYTPILFKGNEKLQEDLLKLSVTV